MVVGLSEQEYKKMAFAYFEENGIEIDDDKLQRFCINKNCLENKGYIREILEKYYPRYRRKYLMFFSYLEECSLAKNFEELEEIYEDFCFFTPKNDHIHAFKKEIYKVGVPAVVMNNLAIVTTIENDEIFVFNAGGVWETAEYKINEMLEKQNKDFKTKLKFSNAQKTEVIAQIKHRTYKPITYFDSSPAYLLPCKNGILDLRSMVLRAYRPEDCFTKKLNVNYAPEAMCARFEQFLEEICVGIGDSEEEIQENQKKMVLGLKQLIGYCFWKDYPIQKMFFLIGGGANGKGVLLNILQHLFGVENVSSVSVKNLADDKFAPAELHTKYVNLSSELTGGEIKNMDFVKALTGGDLISAQKKFKNPFNFINHAKLMIASNHPPQIGDASVGFYRRVHIFDFTRTFLGKDADKSLTKQLTSEEALSGILNIALEQLTTWIDERGNFKVDADFVNSMPVDEIRLMYELRSDPINAFIFDCITASVDDDAYILKEDVYKFYTAYCRNRNLPNVTPMIFAREFKTKARFVSDVRRRIDGYVNTQERCWFGLKIDEEKIKKPEKRNFSQAFL